MNAALKLMTPDAFLDWCQYQEDRWELVDGMPRMMTGATRRHDRIVVNLIIDLGNKLRGKPCQPNTADVAARMLHGNVRRPDVTVDCASVPDKSLSSTAPTVFFEVLSPSTRTIDLLRKAEEFKQTPTLRHIVIIEPDRPQVLLWSRSDEADPWVDRDIEGVDGIVPLTAIDVTLPMTAIYEGVRFETDV
ncbi:Uma2 family endonuclease [Brevundimonas sp. R86498]|uniref:Uma2 family endonuclease n=1 Tax=Brevundimonas sp. R86498 TaxID=3093845 RepID=UPI0037CB4B8D